MSEASPSTDPLARDLSRQRRLHIRGLVLPCNIGVYAHEKGREQRVRIEVVLAVDYGEATLDDDLAKVVSYDDIVGGIRALLRVGHINLVETLADRIAEMCMADARVTLARVVVEKLDVLSGGAVPGAETELSRPRRG